jgi:hypothetical protein
VTRTVELPSIAQDLKDISQQLLETADRLIQMTDAQDGGEDDEHGRDTPDGSGSQGSESRR